MTFANINTAWGSLVIEECVRSSVNYFCVAPGSRSSPLTIAVARHKKAKHLIHWDERGLAYHAVGYVAATGQPAVLICTSGTAVANFLPAVIEASKKKIPLIVMTADRPPELRHSGSPQTIDQPGIFGKYAVWHVDVPCPDMAIPPEFVLTTMDQAIHQAHIHRGVVHVNVMFREPLTPQDMHVSWGHYFEGIRAWSKQDKPFTSYVSARGTLSTSDLLSLAARLQAMRQGLIVVGKTHSSQERKAILNLAEKLGWPLIVDIASGLRLGNRHPQIIHYADQILVNKKGLDPASFDGIVHLGGRISSARVNSFISSCKTLKDYVMVLDHPLRNDPAHQVTCRVQSSVLDFAQRMLKHVPLRKSSGVLSHLAKLNEQVDQHIEDYLTKDERLNEMSVARLVSQRIPKGTGLFLSNSMPIRDMDMYADFKGKEVKVSGNRGASGIDGIIASASGMAKGINQHVTLMIGDLAALHDLNSLALLRDTPPLIIVILNNGGGGIFSFLPIAQHPDVAEKFFGTPHPFTFAQAAAMFELRYDQPVTVKQFKHAYAQAVTSLTSTIIEVVTTRNENVQAHRLLQASL